MNENKSILFFDGVCNLCNNTIDFFIKRDTKKVFRYAPLQSETAKNVLPKETISDLNTVVLYHGGKTYYKSAAILQALSLLGAPYSITKVFKVIPSALCDVAYDFISKNRYRFFGKKDSCRLPTPQERELFLN